ncbi:large ribosomal subunit protein eL14 isoform X1 [Dermacentor andersoni]|uniref:large ribosomal subunit protein eL14 isoform X1 n=1 Tax=Dermacentor andersoni TaxID=34620 RepID=UPI002415E07F|nr:60S ribosomal protein L14-like isoform X1 [Dermacentor andersoni]
MKLTLRTFVEIGRVVYLTHGKYRGRLCGIVNIVDQNRAVVDGPETGVPRQAVPFKHMRLTRQKIRVPMGTSTKVVRKAWVKNDVTQKWNESALAKKLAARRLKANMNDFDRFKLRRAKQSLNKVVRLRFLKLKSLSKKAAKKGQPEKPEKKAAPKKK